ncbi:phosphotransferase family protein [soil metagenome]
MLDPAEHARLDALFGGIASLAATPRTIEELSGGLTNYNLKVTTPDGVFVARCNRSDTVLLGIDREAEQHNTRAAELSGVGAPFVEYRPDLGILVIGFLNGHSYENEDLQRPGVLPRAAKAIKQLHDGPRFAGDFDMFLRQSRYLETLTAGGHRMPADYRTYDPQFQRIKTALAVLRGPTVPCNNDLLAGNFVDGGDTIWIIDYEYSGNNDPYFELGNTWTECGLSDEQLDEFVTAYVGHRDSCLVARTRLQATVSRYGWSLWGFIQAATNDFDFDFYGWGFERYEAAVADFESSEFETLLATASGVTS